MDKASKSSSSAPRLFYLIVASVAMRLVILSMSGQLVVPDAWSAVEENRTLYSSDTIDCVANHNRTFLSSTLNNSYQSLLATPRLEIPPMGKITPWAAPNAMMGNRTVAVCATIKDELPHIDEWVDYNLGLGMAAIYIYDNAEEPHAMVEWEQDRRYMRGEPVSVVHHPGRMQQCAMYASCFKRALDDGHTWVLVVDVDEFLVLKQHDHVADFAAEYCPAGQLGISLRLFGMANQTSYRRLPVTYRFQHHIADNYH